MAAGLKVVILAGGRGSRLGKLTEARPKPLVEVGGAPILCHILLHYLSHGLGEFIIAAGYLGDRLRRFFSGGDCRRCIALLGGAPDRVPCRVSVVDTGPDTTSSGRLLGLAPRLEGATFMLTWADGVSDLPLDRLLDFHRRHGRLATVTAVAPPARFGYLDLRDDRVVDFQARPDRGPGWINGAFFVLEPGVFDYIHADDESWEQGAMARLAGAGELMAYRHDGYWQCMDTPEERDLLDRLWASGQAPWKVWV